MDHLALNSVHWLRRYIAIFDTNLVWVDFWQCLRYNAIDAYQTVGVHAAKFNFSRKVKTLLSRYTYVNAFDHRV